MTGGGPATSTPGADLGDREGALTWGQQLLWTGQQLHPRAPLYNMVLAFELVGPFSSSVFEQAFQSVVDRADALRTVFEEKNGHPVRVMRKPFRVEIEQVDLSSSLDPDRAAAAWVEERARVLFVPGQVMFDCVVLRLGPERHVWYLNQHHLITDAWSTGLVFRYTAEAYARLIDTPSEGHPPLPSYSDFAGFCEESKDSPRLEGARGHWAKLKQASIGRTQLYGLANPTGAGHSTRTERITLDLGAERSAKIRTLAGSPEASALTEHASRFNVFAALVLGFCARVSGQHEVALGAPAHNRVTAPFKDTVGLFIEVFPLRATVDPEAPFSALLGTVRTEASSMLRHAYPGASDGALNRAVNIVLNYISAQFSDFAGLETRSRWVHSGHGDGSHDLRVQVHDFDDDDAFVVHLDVAIDRFDAPQRALVGRHFLAFIDSVLAQPTSALRDLSLVDDAEAEELLTRFSGSAAADSEEAVVRTSVLEHLRAGVLEHPERMALKSGATCWSYEDLYARAINVARALEPFDVRGGRVALVVPRSAEAVAAMLGVLEAGATYVPIDLDAPPDRALYMLDAVRPAVAIVANDGALRGDLPTLLVDEALTGVGGGVDVGDWIGRAPDVSPTDLAYILFTSGSTGRPKGVMVEHHSLAHYATWAANEYATDAARTFALFTPLTFDLTVTSIFAPLVGGGTIVVYEDRGETVDTAVLDVFEDDGVDVVKLTPSHLALVVDRPAPPKRVRTLVLGGEELTTQLARSAQSWVGPEGRVINEFGPTEATVACTVHEFDHSCDTGRSVPIGRPIPGAHLSVMDNGGGLAATGVVGEILIGGTGVARGYLSEAQTAERFVRDPVDSSKRAYLSGDLGRWRSDGTLEFLGRADRQVKIHGVRIEPAEIEAVLAEHEGITSSAVIAATPPAAAAKVPTDNPPIRTCVTCGLPSDHPDVAIGEDGVCSLCTAFDGYRDQASQYFGSMPELNEVLSRRGASCTGEFDCLMLLSGGKDSSYALYQLVEMGLEVYAVTLDNGYISDGAKANVRRVTEDLGVPHAFLTTDAMNDVFVDSLERFSNVCQGCFKTMYTLAFNFALERGIPSIVTGLSRGQFFETRLTEELFLGAPRSRKGLELVVLDARKAYHRVDDLVNRALDTEAFQTDASFERVAFVDFYRYCDVELSEMLAFLDERAPWIRPADTGRSTNCLINDVGIYVHKLERGFHNYALPYSWDVRMGHKDRDAALDELDDSIDPDRVKRILDEIGYTPKVLDHEVNADVRLTAFVTGPAADRPQELRGFLKARLPSFLIPARFVRVEALPVTTRGKVDTTALERLASERTSMAKAGVRPDSVPPTSPTEISVAALWSDALGLATVGLLDNFFDLGGDSITAIRIAARGAAAGLPLTPNDLFRHQTVDDLARALDSKRVTVEASSKPTEKDGEPSGLDAGTLDQVAALLRRADRGGDGEHR